MNWLIRLVILSLLLQYPAAAQSKADLIVLNANIRTMAASPARAEAMAVIGNTIAAVGSNKEIAAYKGSATRVIDARGRLVLPGFNDAHVHWTAIGQTFSSVDLRGTKTPQEMIGLVAHHARFVPENRWILGFGWSNENWTPSTLPTRKLLDAVSPRHPVFLYHADGRSAVANSRTLALANIDKATTKADGEILRDETGEPTGRLRGPAMARVAALVPRDHYRNWHELAETASNYAASLGVTSVQDVHSDELAGVYRELERQGKLKTRIYDCAPLSSWARLQSQSIKRSWGKGFVRTGCLKHFADGETGEIPALEKAVIGADKADLQVMLHAMGPEANNFALNVFEKLQKENGVKDRRFRIEHAYGVRLGDLPRFAASGVIASMQPWLFYGGPDSDADHKGLLDLGARLAFGSDASMTDLDPLLGIYAAVTGKGAIWVEQAVRSYTYGSAYAEFQDNVKGTLEIGKLADFIILSDDIFTIDPVKIRDVKVLTTVVDGKLVFQLK